MKPPREDSQPWYRQFWPWFLIALPASVVVASMFTINLAIESNDGLVTDDYYKEGLAINKDAARVETAHRLGVVAELALHPDSGEVDVQLNDVALGQLDHLTLALIHPTRSNRDQRISLTAAGGHRYVGRIAALEAANWRVSLEPPARNWRLSGRLAIPESHHTELQ